MENLKHLFIIEDSLDFQLLLQTIFRREGYNVDCASNGQDALVSLRAKTDLPCVILLDIMMPVMDGFEFRAQQKQDPRLASIPVVVMTAHGDIQSTKAKAGVRDIIRKPSDVQTFLKVVGDAC